MFTWEGRDESQQLAFSCQFTPICSKFTFSKLWQTPFNPAYTRVSRTRHTGHRNNLGLPPPRSTLPSQQKKGPLHTNLSQTIWRTATATPSHTRRGQTKKHMQRHGSLHRYMQESEPRQKDATSPYSRNLTNPSKQIPQTRHTHNMATTSSKTVQPPQTQTHAWQAHLNQSQNIFRSALHHQLPSIQPPSPKKRQPFWSALFGSGPEGVAQLAT